MKSLVVDGGIYTQPPLCVNLSIKHTMNCHNCNTNIAGSPYVCNRCTQSFHQTCGLLLDNFSATGESVTGTFSCITCAKNDDSILSGDLSMSQLDCSNPEYNQSYRLASLDDSRTEERVKFNKGKHYYYQYLTYK